MLLIAVAYYRQDMPGSARKELLFLVFTQQSPFLDLQSGEAWDHHDFTYSGHIQRPLMNSKRYHWEMLKNSANSISLAS